jgi:hypothetical protein
MNAPIAGESLASGEAASSPKIFFIKNFSAAIHRQ